MSLASLVTAAISLMLLGCAWVVVINADYIAVAMESELEINVYLRSDADTNRAVELKQAFELMEEVASAVFVSKDEGLKTLNQRFGQTVNLLEALEGDNPLPDMFRIQAKEAEGIPALAEKIRRMAGVDTVRYGQGMIERLLKATRWARLAGVFVVAATALAALFLIATTIRITVFSRREEISIMKLVGATNWYIRWPFFLEGMMIGLLGAALATLALHIFYGRTVQYLTESLNFIPIMTEESVMLEVYRSLIVFGTCLGALGSALSVRRFLKI
jgi:cell division transport system permease protein